MAKLFISHLWRLLCRHSILLWHEPKLSILKNSQSDWPLATKTRSTIKYTSWHKFNPKHIGDTINIIRPWFTCKIVTNFTHNFIVTKFKDLDLIKSSLIPCSAHFISHHATIKSSIASSSNRSHPCYLSCHRKMVTLEIWPSLS